MSGLRPFGDHAERMRDSGCMPVPLEGKKPLIRGWNSRPMGKRAIKNLIARSPHIAQANLGLRTGKLVAIDIDEDDPVTADRAVYMVFAVLGTTPFIRIGRYPRRVLFYRSDTEVVSGRVGSTEILGKNRVVAVAGIHPGTGKPYSWPEECLLDHALCDLPLVDQAKLDRLAQHLKLEHTAPPVRSRDGVQERAHAVAIEILKNNVNEQLRSRLYPRGSVAAGQRNDALFRALKDKAHGCRHKSGLLSKAREINADFIPPLSHGEVEAIVESVWGYKARGKLMVSGRQQTLLPLGKDEVLALGANAVMLLALLKVTRSTKTFTIPQRATGKLLAWGPNRVKEAIDTLLRHGQLRKVGTPRPLHASRYQFASA